MADLTHDQLLGGIYYVLTEAVESPTPPGSAFLDPKTGLFDTLAGLTLERAFKEVGEGRPSIAAHLKHSSFHLNACRAYMHGERVRRDWQGSFRVPEPSEAVWKGLVDEFRLEYGQAKTAIKELALSNEDNFTTALGMVAHVAYHLGAIRQLIHLV